MADPKTVLVLPGTKMSVSRFVKRAAQALGGAACSLAVIGIVMVVNGLLSGRGTTMQWVHAWLAFVQRPDIVVTVLLTALSTVLFVYWYRDQERGR